MRLGISNLAWPAEQTAQILARLAKQEVVGIEVAPTRISAWDSLTSLCVRQYRNQIESAGLEICSLQSIFFDRPECQLLGDVTAFVKMIEHIRIVADIAAELGAQAVVFGAPRNRLRGALSEAEACERAADRLRLLGDVLSANRLTLAVEPVPAVYGGDFLLRASEVRSLVLLCGHPGIGTHLDSACISLGGDTIADEILATGSGIVHYHIAEPNLGSFCTPASSHELAGKALRDVKFLGWTVIEMREQPHYGDAIDRAISLAKAAYG